ncbi:MAG: hypothetical protein IPP10_15465 [Candidatus Competibacteraceae bacterium]|nr:hypothetical protein [Candidatus Competibacteraceae bacterium]
MGSLEQLRALIDKVNKQTPKLPTGGDGRMTAEALNTSAIAKGQAMSNSKIANATRTLPLRELQLKR